MKAAGFDDGTLRVLFHSGHFKDYEGRTAAELEELLAAPSKGRFVHERFAGRPITPAASAALDTFQHDDCCAKRLRKALASGRLAGVDSWTCPTCEGEWYAELVDGRVRHWKPREWIARLR